jgi:hypothetical protein
MKPMTHKRLLSLIVLATLLASLVSIAAATTQTLTGIITDDMCGKKHTMMAGHPHSDCVRECVKAGGHYALLAGDKLYVMKGDTRQFDQLALRSPKSPRRSDQALYGTCRPVAPVLISGSMQALRITNNLR